MKKININNNMILLILFIIGIVVFFRGFDINYYADDLQEVYKNPGDKIFYYMYNVPADGFYRPIQLLILTFSQTFFGHNTVFLHILYLIIHVLFCWSIYLFMMELGLSSVKSIIASLFMLLSQTNAASVLNNDTISQLLSSFAGFLSLMFLYKFLRINYSKIISIRSNYFNSLFLLSLLFFGIALFSKESSLSYLPILFFTIVFYTLNEKSSKLNIRVLATYLIPYLIVFVIYYIIRSYAGGRQPTTDSNEAYVFAIGMNIIANFFMSMFATVIPFPTETLYVWIKSRNFSNLSIPLAIIFIFLLLVIYGLMKSGKGRLIFALIAFSVLSTLPMILLTHVREFHAYNTTPYVSMMIGIGLGSLIESRFLKFKKILALSVIIIILIIQVISIQLRITKMKSNGEKAWTMIDQILPHIENVPLNGSLILMNPENNQVEYSVMIMNDFNVLNTGLTVFNELSERKDFQTIIIKNNELHSFKNKSDNIILYLEDGTVKELKAINYQ